MMDSIGAGSAREQAQRAGQVYEQRLNALSPDRDLRAEEAVRAQERFNLALDAGLGDAGAPAGLGRPPARSLKPGSR